MASGRGRHEDRGRPFYMAGACGSYGQRPADGWVSVSCYCGGIFSGKGLEENGKSEAGRSCAGASAVSVFIKVPLAVLGISLLVLGALGKPVFELLRGIASAMV